MREVTRYQADDGTLHETAVACLEYDDHRTGFVPKPPVPPGNQWGIWDLRYGCWWDANFPRLFDSREDAEEELRDWGDSQRKDFVVAQYSARPPAPREDGEHVD